MKTTKLFFNSAEISVLAALTAELAMDLLRRGVGLDERKRRDLTRRVLDVAASGISDPHEIRTLVLERYMN